MTAYNIVGSSSLVAGQAEDVGQVLANFQAIQAVINGNLDNTNIAAAAGITLSKLGQSGATTNQVPQWNGSAWVPAAAGGSPSGTAGQILAFIGTTLTAVTPASLTSTIAGASVGAGPLMMGYGKTITPTFSGRICVAVSCGPPQGGESGSWAVGLRFGTGGAPGNGSAAAGTLVGNRLGGSYDVYGGANHHGDGTWNITKIITGLVVGTTYWLDLDGSNIDLGAGNFEAFEF